VPGGCDDWWRAACEELDTARKLKPVGKVPQAYHHAGQAVEFALKAIYMKRNGHRELPEECKGAAWHHLPHIVKAARLEPDIAALHKANRARFENWLTVRDWDSNARFPGKKRPLKELNDLHLAVCHERDGIMQWLELIFQKS
jgi:hypothetical protein